MRFTILSVGIEQTRTTRTAHTTGDGTMAHAATIVVRIANADGSEDTKRVCSEHSTDLGYWRADAIIPVTFGCPECRMRDALNLAQAQVTLESAYVDAMEAYEYERMGLRGYPTLSGAF